MEENSRKNNEESFNAFLKEFSEESDRAAVVLGAAKLDFSLYQLLVRFLLPSSGSRDELLEGDSPLSTFSAKINLCFRLGLIDAEFTRALHMIRKIRNEFAHDVSSSKLDAGSHRDRIRDLIAPISTLDIFNNVKEDTFFSVREPASKDFLTMLSLMVFVIDLELDEVKTVNCQPVISFRLDWIH